MTFRINLNNWKVRDFWGVVGAGIAGVTGVVTGGNYLRRASLREREQKMEKRRIKEEIDGYYRKGSYSLDDVKKAYKEQGIKEEDYTNNLSNYVGQSRQDELTRANVAKRKTTKKPKFMNGKSKIGSISLSNNFENIRNSFNNPTLYNYSPGVSWIDGLNSSTKRPVEQYVVAEAGPSNSQNLPLMETLSKPRNATALCAVTFFASAGLYLVVIKKLRQTKWFTKNFELNQWTMDKINEIETEISEIKAGQKQMLANQAKMLDLLKKVNI